MVPEYVLWGLRTVQHQAGEVHGEALLQVDVGTPHYLGVGLWGGIYTGAWRKCIVNSRQRGSFLIFGLVGCVYGT